MLIDDIEDTARQQQARELELELIHVRSQAEAARLEARAAELELLLRRMARRSDIDLSQSVFAAKATHDKPSFDQSIHSHHVSETTSDSWSTRLARLNARSQEHSSQDKREFAPALSASVSAFKVESAASPAPLWSPRIPLDVASPQQTDLEPTWNRVDSSSHIVQPAHFIEPPSAPIKSAETSHDIALPKRGRSTDKIDVKTEPIKSYAAIAVPTLKIARPKPIAVTTPLPALKTVDSEDDDEAKWHFRPAAWFVSTVAHVAVILMLGLFTLATNPPKDQLAFTASASESSEQSMETFSIESSQPVDQTEPTPTETAYEISTVGTMAITEVSLDVPPAPASPTTAEMFSESSSSLSSSAMKSLKSDTNSKMQFCGVDGGGSHFVYLVDSSNSMHEGFQAARAELLNSIDQLKPDQRFYVIFYDKKPDYMRISDPNVDESASVMATPENRQRLRKWAMTVEMNEGLNPSKLLPFAINLRADVIFLLSDGEFPDSVGKVLLEQNHEENFFGEAGPISIVHTIRYHGMEGEIGQKAEATMVKIAKENGGQYRYVPKPKQ